MADDPNRDYVPVKDCRQVCGPAKRKPANNNNCPSYSAFGEDSKDLQQRHYVMKLDRDELEDRFLRMMEDHMQLKKKCNAQEEKIKRLATKLLRIVSDRDRALKSASDRKDYHSEQRLDDMQARINDLESCNQQLQERIMVLKTQLGTHSKLHASVHSNTSASPGRSMNKSQPCSRSCMGMDQDTMVKQETGDQDIPGESMSANTEESLKRKVKHLEQEIAAMQDQNHTKILQLEQQLSYLTAEEQRNRAAENIEMIRMKREMQAQTTAMDALKAKVKDSEMELDRIRCELRDCQKNNCLLNTELTNVLTSKQALQEQLQAANGRSDHSKDLMAQVSDLQREQESLKSQNSQLLEIASKTLVTDDPDCDCDSETPGADQDLKDMYDEMERIRSLSGQDVPVSETSVKSDGSLDEPDDDEVEEPGGPEDFNETMEQSDFPENDLETPTESLLIGGVDSHARAHNRLCTCDVKNVKAFFPPCRCGCSLCEQAKLSKKGSHKNMEGERNKGSTVERVSKHKKTDPRKSGKTRRSNSLGGECSKKCTAVRSSNKKVVPTNAESPIDSPTISTIKSPSIPSKTESHIDSPTISSIKSPSISSKTESHIDSPTISAIKSPSIPSKTESPIDSPTNSAIMSPSISSNPESPIDSPTTSAIKSPSISSHPESHIDSPTHSAIKSPSIPSKTESPIDSPTISTIKSPSIPSKTESHIDSPTNSAIKSPSISSKTESHIDSPTNSAIKSPSISSNPESHIDSPTNSAIKSPSIPSNPESHIDSPTISTIKSPSIPSKTESHDSPINSPIKSPSIPSKTESPIDSPIKSPVISPINSRVKSPLCRGRSDPGPTRSVGDECKKECIAKCSTNKMMAPRNAGTNPPIKSPIKSPKKSSSCPMATDPGSTKSTGYECSTECTAKCSTNKMMDPNTAGTTNGTTVREGTSNVSNASNASYESNASNASPPGNESTSRKESPPKNASTPSISSNVSATSSAVVSNRESIPSIPSNAGIPSQDSGNDFKPVGTDVRSDDSAPSKAGSEEDEFSSNMKEFPKASDRLHKVTSSLATFVGSRMSHRSLMPGMSGLAIGINQADILHELGVCKELLRVQCSLNSSFKNELTKLYGEISKLDGSTSTPVQCNPSNCDLGKPATPTTLQDGMRRKSLLRVGDGEGLYEIHAHCIDLNDEGVKLIPAGQDMFLTWTFYDQDIAFTPVKKSPTANINTSAVYRVLVNEKFLEHLRTGMCTIDLHTSKGDSSKLVARGTLNMSEAPDSPQNKIHTSMRLLSVDQCKGPQMIGTLQCWFRLSCELELIKNYSASCSPSVKQPQESRHEKGTTTSESLHSQGAKTSQGSQENIPEGPANVSNQSKIKEENFYKCPKKMKTAVGNLTEASLANKFETSAGGFERRQNDDDDAFSSTEKLETYAAEENSLDLLAADLDLKMDGPLILNIEINSFVPDQTMDLYKNVAQIYVEFTFLGLSGPELETKSVEVSRGNLVFNYKKGFNYSAADQQKILADIYQGSTWKDTALQFVIVSEPFEDEGMEIDCEEIGFADVDLKQLISNGQDLVKSNIAVYGADGKTTDIGKLNISIRGMKNCHRAIRLFLLNRQPAG